MLFIYPRDRLWCHDVDHCVQFSYGGRLIPVSVVFGVRFDGIALQAYHLGSSISS